MAFDPYSFLVATIDSDIANIPENEFAPIFAGGIIVMFGGLISALVVGLILEQRGLYANVIAETYAQSGEDEEFWKNLSDEEKMKAQEMLDRLRASKQKTTSAPLKSDGDMTKVKQMVESRPTDAKVDMFSDYGES